MARDDRPAEHSGERILHGGLELALHALNQPASAVHPLPASLAAVPLLAGGRRCGVSSSCIRLQHGTDTVRPNGTFRRQRIG